MTVGEMGSATPVSGDGQHAFGPERANKIEVVGSCRLALGPLARGRASVLSLAVIVLVVAMALAAPLVAAITGHGVYEQFRTIGLSPDGLPQAPNSTFWLGTDDQGRDVLVRIAYGARISLLVGVVATALTVAIG